MGTSIDLYSPPDTAAAESILGRYRRPVWGPLAESYIAAWTAPGDLVLDPFCQDVTVIGAAAAAGRRAVAITGNPLLALLTRVEAAPPAEAALETALNKIQFAPKVDVSLGPYLDGLYATACSRCREQVPATAFVWDRAAGLPVLRDYTCPHCHYAAREPVPAEETVGHLSLAAHGFHRRLLAERLRVDGGHRRLQERLLELYTPRNLYALTSLLLKIELLFNGSPLLDPLRVALLHTLDVASKLNLVTEEGWQPVHSLRPPRRFREANVWRTFATAVRALAAQPPRESLALAASLEEALESPGVAYVGVEPLPRLAARLGGQVALALSQLPRFEPTFAALSYLWSGCLLGREGSRAAERLLRQRTPEEAHYLRALQAALAAGSATVAPGGRLALVFQAPATRYLETVLVAAGTANLPLLHAWHGVLDDWPAGRFEARRVEHHLVFGPRGAPESPPGERAERAQALAARTAASVVAERGEPTPFGALHGPIWDALARAGLLGGSPGQAEAESLRQRLGSAVERGLIGSLDALLAISAVGEESERTTWWLRSPPAAVTPLSDRVEALVREALGRHRALDEVALGREIGQRFPAALTPPWPLIRACLVAYGAPAGPGQWVLAEEEQPQAEAERRRRSLDGLVQLGQRLGYEVQEAPAERQLRLACCASPGVEGPGRHLAWLEGVDSTWEFTLRDSAESADLRAMAPPASGQRVLVISERRVGLWQHKLAVAPAWAAELRRAGWTFLRQDALDRLLGQPAERGRFAAALGLGEPGAQLSLFS